MTIDQVIKEAIPYESCPVKEAYAAQRRIALKIRIKELLGYIAEHGRLLANDRNGMDGNARA